MIIWQNIFNLNIKVSSMLVIIVTSNIHCRAVWQLIFNLYMKVSGILVISVDIKLHSRYIWLSIFNLHMKVSCLLAISVTNNLQNRILPPTGQWSTRDRDSTVGIIRTASWEPSLTETHPVGTPMRGRYTGLLLIKLCWLLMLLNDMYLVGLDFCVRKHTNNSFTKIKYPFQHDAWYSSTIPYWSKG